MLIIYLWPQVASVPFDNHENHLTTPSETTPWKVDMAPINHPFRKEHDLPNLHDYVMFHINLQGCAGTPSRGGWETCCFFPKG